MRREQLEVENSPTYLLHPQNRRVEYGGGFRIIKPERLNDHQQLTTSIPHITEFIKQPQFIPTSQFISKPIQPIIKPTISPSVPQYGYDYYHGDRNFSNFFGLEDQQFHICTDHRDDCHVCHTCKPGSGFSKADCYLCSGKKNGPGYTKVTKVVRPQSQKKHDNQKKQSKYGIEQQKKQIIDSQPAQILSPSIPSPQIILSEHQFPQNYQIIDQPIPPQNPSVQQKVQYQRKYKDYLLKKRDLYYLTILKKLIDKIDFQRYQCTSPNQQRVHAHWFGIYRPRIMQTSGGKVKYQIENHPGYQFLKSYVFVYVYQGKYKDKEGYEVNAQNFLNGFQEVLGDTQKSNPIKALQKLHAESYKRMLEGKIEKIKLGQFLRKMSFITMAFGIVNLEIRLERLVKDLGLAEYKRLFTMIVNEKPKPPQIKEIQKSLHHKQSKQKIPFKPIFPQLQYLQNDSLKIYQTIKSPSQNNTKKLTIRQKRLLDDLLQRQSKQQQLINYKFKAKQIPKDVRDRSLYQRILDQQAHKSAQNREQSAKQLLQNQNPFNFYYRDLNKSTPVEQFKQYQLFKASDVPHYVLEPRYEKMIEQKEVLKKQHLQQRQSELLRTSKFPATMGYLENYSTLKGQRQEQLPYKFQPSISKDVPNFEQLQRKNIAQLESKKEMNRTITTPQEFNLSKNTNKKKNEESIIPQKPQLKKRGSQSVDHRQYVSGSTLKYDALVDLRRKQNEQKQKKQILRQSQLLSKSNKNQEALKERLQKTVKEGDVNVEGNFVMPLDHWNEIEKEKMLSKVYEERPMLIDRRYERVNGMKVEVDVVPK